MMNYIWLTLILVGAGVAVWSDWSDIRTDRYRNGTPVECTIEAGPAAAGAARGAGGKVVIPAAGFAAAYGVKPAADIVAEARFTSALPAAEGGSAGAEILLGEGAPRLWREISAGQRADGFLRATLRREGGGAWSLTADPVRFVRLNAVTNDGIVRYAKTAVEIAIGLIGIMALWLGLMKIAEQAGLVAALSRFLRPLTSRLFPDVPPDHPAMGAMLMNISANMLGLANAATPLGLKAMEELNRLNRKVGTATDAMCTFLVINTSSVQLIPATVIAIRAASGSANPAEIIGPALFATAINTVIGVTVVKLLARMRVFRRQLAGGEAP
jgi:spore maturation protein A